MSLMRLLVVIAIAFGGYKWWTQRSADKAYAKVVASSPAGFIPVLMPDGAKPNTVFIFAPENCPSEAAQRADALASTLTQHGIPNVRSSSFSLHIENPSDEIRETLRRGKAVMEGEVPAVLINGMGKSNPSADEVISEYRRTRS